MPALTGAGHFTTLAAAMNRPTHRLGVSWSAVLLLCAHSARLPAQSLPNDSARIAPAPRHASEQVVVLQNGGVIVGSVSHEGDRYLVTNEHSVLSIASTDVVRVCDSLTAAYDQRRAEHAGGGKGTADGHLDLATWCLRHELWPQAARELLDARHLEPDHPRLALLERQLTLATAPEFSRSIEARDDAQSDSARTKVNEPSITADTLPDGAIEQFTRRVQPVLVNSCSAIGCHERAGKQRFQLDRAILHGLSNRRTTMYNLAATLELVNWQQPSNSPLLTAPREPHGQMGEPVFGPRDVRLRELLAEWVTLVARDPAHEEPQPLVADRAAPVLYPPRGAVNHNGPVVLGKYPADDCYAVGGAGTRSDGDFRQTLAPMPRVRFGARLTPLETRDEFDPEIFNRQSR